MRGRARGAGPAGFTVGRLRLVEPAAFALDKNLGLAETREDAPHVGRFDRANRPPLLLDGHPEPGDEPHPLVRAQRAVGRVRGAAQVVEHDLLAARAHAPILPEPTTVIAADAAVL
jgi:hypothetical protein